MKQVSQCRFVWLWTLAVLLAGTMALYAQEAAQSQGQGPAGRRGGRGGPGGGGPPGGGFDRAAMEQRMMTGLRERLGATEEEWTAIEPLLKTVMEKQRAVRGAEGNVFSLFMRPEGDRGGRGPGLSGEQSPELEALSKTLENTSASPDEIKAKLEALKQARAKQQEELKKAREALRGALSIRQEAQLTLVGILD